MANGGLIPKQIMDKNGKATTVWVKPEQGIPAGSKEQLSAAPNLSTGGGDNFISEDDGKPLSSAEKDIASMVNVGNSGDYTVTHEYYDDIEDLADQEITPEASTSLKKAEQTSVRPPSRWMRMTTPSPTGPATPKLQQESPGRLDSTEAPEVARAELILAGWRER